MHTDDKAIITYNYTSPAQNEQQLTIRSIEDFIANSSPSIGQPHCIKFFLFIVIFDGHAEHEFDQHILHLDARDVTILIPGQIHCFKKYTGVKGYVISFKDTFLFEVENTVNFQRNLAIIFNFQAFEKVSLGNVNFATICHLCTLFWAEVYRDYHKNNALILQHLFTAFLLVIDREMHSGGVAPYMDKHRKLSIEFKILVFNNIHAKNNVQYYADQLNVAVKTLQDSMKISFKESPKKFLKKALILKAKQLLQNQTLQIQEVAYFLGYNEPTNFTKFFKKETDFTAEDYRKNYIR